MRLPPAWPTALALTAVVGGRWWSSRRRADHTSGSGHTVRTDDGVRLHVQVDGRRDAGLTVVLAHGFAARSAMFDQQWPALRGHARLVRYDQRGHGASGWAGCRPATADRLGRDLAQVIDELAGPGPVVVVGHSMGGMAVLALAGLRPELFGGRIAGVALLSTRAAPMVGDGDTRGALLRTTAALATAGSWLLWLVAPLLEALHPFRTGPGRWVLRRRLFAGDASDRTSRAVTRSWAGTPIAVMAAYLVGLARYDERAASDTLAAVPVLVLAGTEDATIPVRSAELLAGRIGARVRLALVPGAGHMVTLTHAASVNAEILDLLTRVRPPSGERTAP